MATLRRARFVLAVSLTLPGAMGALVWAGTPKSDYEQLLARERTLASQDQPTPQAVRRLATAYEAFASRHENTGYADNALWNGAQLASDLFDRTRREQDRQAAVRMLARLVKSYPSSSLVPGAREQLRELSPPASTRGDVSRPASTRRAPASPDPGARTGTTVPDPAIVTRDLEEPPASATRGASAPATGSVHILDVRRSVSDESVRVTVELDAETPFREERLADPPRVYFDLSNATAAPALLDRALNYPDDVVRQVRVGRRPDSVVRVAMDLEGVRGYSAFTLYNPYRLVVDFERSRPAPPLAGNASSPPHVTTPLPTAPLPASLDGVPATEPAPVAAAEVPGTDESEPRATDPTPPPAALPPPAAPPKNSTGAFSIARQLGLGVSRVVIDPGHGGHDPGAQGTRLSEAELVLDVALRLEKLLLAQPGVDVVLTRRTDTFVPLEERTAIANRERADLFLSIHANASRNRKARGVETYYLNFASNPEAAAVAARENSASGRAMHNLPDMVSAIALNNKLDESRDLAGLVQDAMVRRLGSRGNAPRNLGVKQAPFVVLIGAQMPSVLAEISFVTHPNEAALLRSPGYRQKIAEALCEAIGRYQRTLKSTGTLAGQ